MPIVPPGEAQLQAYMRSIGFDPHSRAPLKSSGADKVDWRPKVGERTSHEYGAFFYKQYNPKTDRLKYAATCKDTDVLGEVDVARERALVDSGATKAAQGAARLSGLGRRPRNLEPSVPPSEEVLYSLASATQRPETEKNAWEQNKGWVPRIGGERPSAGLSGLGRRLRGCEPSMESLGL